MANVPESSIWVSGIYQLEITDPVLGGLGGIDNQQATQLGNRTKYLYDQGITQNSTLVDHENRIDDLEAINTDARLDDLEAVKSHVIDVYAASFMSGPGSGLTEDKTVIFPTKLIDDLNEYSTSTGRFTPQKAGKYKVSVNVTMYTVGGAVSSDDSQWYLSFKKNGTPVNKNMSISIPLDPADASPRTKVSCSISKIIEVNGTTDYIEFYIYNTHGFLYGVLGNFNAHLIG